MKPAGTEEGRDASHPDKAGSVPVGQTGHGPAAYLGWLPAWLLHTSGSPQFSPVPPPQQALLGLQLHFLIPVLGIAHHLIVKSKLGCSETPNAASLSGKSPPHIPHVTQELCGHWRFVRRFLEKSSVQERCRSGCSTLLKGVIETRTVSPDKPNSPKSVW